MNVNSQYRYITDINLLLQRRFRENVRLYFVKYTPCRKNELQVSVRSMYRPKCTIRHFYKILYMWSGASIWPMLFNRRLEAILNYIKLCSVFSRRRSCATNTVFFCKWCGNYWAKSATFSGMMSHRIRALTAIASTRKLEVTDTMQTISESEIWGSHGG
jgi:hypothetical protein